ncbi:MAG: cytochrome-c peroxidase [Alistipes sp.]|nr:cytochrome-c peroxidase [Alistipes sp.]
MKKKLLFLVLLLVVVALAIFRISDRVPSADYPLDKRVAAIFVKGGCLDCHSAEPQMPFYFKLPVVGNIMKKDVDEGYRAFDMEPLWTKLQAGDNDFNPVDVAKIEKVAIDKRMPMVKYYLVHWGSRMTNAKRDVILEWAAAYRTAYYHDGVCGCEPVRPIDLLLPYDEAKAALGFKLYHDKRLSIDNTISCASCHGLNTAGVDNKPFSEGVEGKLGGVNAPTVFNAVYNFVQFWDGRAQTLADQAAGPPVNPVEMASPNFDAIVAKLNKDKKFAREFKAVYPEGFTQATITDAIEQFERTLITPNSRFDKYLRGDKSAITAEELEGYELFKKYNCATCHVGKNLGGESYELMGLRKHYFADRGLDLTEEDNGRFKQTGVERDRHRFKVPGLRNVALTWPYYHDGTRTLLKEAVCAMGTYQSGVELTDEEEDKIVAFLNTLTGEYQGKLLTNANEQK